jgi:phosphate transport system substrate-binding protein
VVRRSLVVIFLLLLTACAPQPLAVTREPVTLRLVSADSCQPLAEALALAYEESFPWITIEVAVFDTLLAERTLRSGNTDLALLSWLEESTDEESLWSQPFARDGVAVIAHPATPLANIGLFQLHEIFRGRVQEWDGVVLTVVSREDGSGTRQAFERIVMGNYDTTLTAVVMPSSASVIEHVAYTPGSLGYVSTLQLQGRVLDNVHVLPVEGVLPTSESLREGSYSLPRTLYLATVGEPAGESREFAQWILGSQGQAVVGEITDQ